MSCQVPLSLSFLSLVLSGVPAAAQDLTVVLQAGDPLPGGAVRFVNGLSVAGDGSWAALVRADGPSTASDDHVLRDGVVLLSEGEPAAGIANATWGGFDLIDQVDADHTFVVADLDTPTPGVADSVVLRNDRVLLRKGDLVSDPRVPAGAYWFNFRTLKASSSTSVLVGGNLEGPSGYYASLLMELELDAAGAVIRSEVRVLEGDMIAGFTAPLLSFGGGLLETAFNARGQLLFYGLATGGGPSTGVFLDGAPVLLEGAASPVAGVNWPTLAGPELDLSDRGSWVVRARLGGATNRDIIVRDGQVFRRQGDAVAAMGGATIGDFGSSCGPFVSNAGTVLWYGDFSGSSADDEALLVDDQILVRENTTTVGGALVVDVNDSRSTHDFAANGAFAVMELDLDVAGVATESLVLARLRPGTSYCTAVPNSTGGPGEIAAEGSAVAQANDLTLRAWALPQNSFGFFLVSRDAAFIAQPGSSQGNLCLGGSIGRYSALAQNSGGAGEISLTLDLTALQQPNGTVAAAAGETWRFQAWYRDANPTVTSNFTNGVAVTLQ